jgi:hypothetical protein
MNDSIRPIGNETGAAAGTKPAAADFSEDIALLQERVRLLRKAASAASGSLPATGGAEPARAAEPGIAQSLLASLAYGQAVHVRTERARRAERKRTDSPERVREPMPGDGPTPDGGRNHNKRGGEE